MPETEPTAWELMRILRDIREDLRDMKRNSITRDEWALAQEATARQFVEVNKRVDGSLLEHKGIEAKIDAVQKDLKQEERARQKEASQRRFTIALAVFGAGLSVVTGIVVFIVQGVIGG